MPQPASTVTPRIERRLAAIMAADIAGYSRLMGVDKIGTLRAHRHERIDPAIARHHGRIVKTTGDGLLVEFASIVDAVACGAAIQRGMLAFNAGVHADRQIVVRIGINVGDIIIDGDDIFGDGVTSLPGWRHCASPVASASRAPPTNRYATSCRWASPIWASRR